MDQYNRDLAEWERQVKEKGKPKRPPEKESVRDRLRQLQSEGKQQRTRKKSQDREDLLGEIKDYYYEGIIKGAKDSVQYSDWSDARGDAYGWWSDARGEVYSNWSDTRGDLYSFYSDMRSELYSGDIDGATDELQDFKDKIAKMK